MERLTEWIGEEWIARQERINGKYPTDRDVYNKLAEYEDFEEQRRLIKLPCKVKEFENLLSVLKYPDKLFIFDAKLAWQGYIKEKQIYRYLEDEEVTELYLGDEGLIIKII